MKLLILGCQTLREGISAAGLFFVAGNLMILASIFVVPDGVLYLSYIVLLLGFLLLILAPIILLSTYLLSVLPGTSKELEKCED